MFLVFLHNPQDNYLDRTHVHIYVPEKVDLDQEAFICLDQGQYMIKMVETLSMKLT